MNTKPPIPKFHLIASRRFMLDNEIVLSELKPGAVACPSLQNPSMPYCPAPPGAEFGGGAMALSAPPDAAAEGTFFAGQRLRQGPRQTVRSNRA